MLKLYVARDREDCPYVSHHLRLYLVKPVRSIEDGLWHTDDWEYPESESLPLPENWFPDLKWEDEPLEVSIIEAFKLQSLRAIK